MVYFDFPSDESPSDSLTADLTAFFDRFFLRLKTNEAAGLRCLGKLLPLARQTEAAETFAIQLATPEFREQRETWEACLTQQGRDITDRLSSVTGTVTGKGQALELIAAQELVLTRYWLGQYLPQSVRHTLELLEQTVDCAIPDDEALDVLQQYLADFPVPDELLLAPFSQELSASDYRLLSLVNPQIHLSAGYSAGNMSQAAVSAGDYRILPLDSFGEGIWNGETQRDGSSSDSFGFGRTVSDGSGLEKTEKLDEGAVLTVKRLEDAPEQLSILFGGRRADKIVRVRVGSVSAILSPAETRLWRADFSRFLSEVRLAMQQSAIVAEFDNGDQIKILPPFLEANETIIPERTNLVLGRNQYVRLSAARYPESFVPCSKNANPNGKEQQNNAELLWTWHAEEGSLLNSISAVSRWSWEPLADTQRVLEIRFFGLDSNPSVRLYTRFFGRVEPISADRPIICVSETRFEALDDYQLSALQIGVEPNGLFITGSISEYLPKERFKRLSNGRSERTVCSNLSFSGDRSNGNQANKTSEAGNAAALKSTRFPSFAQPDAFGNNTKISADSSETSEILETSGASNALKNRSQNDDRWFLLPTPEQREVLDGMGTLPRLLIQGSAGTGKTMLGFYQAEKFARAGRSTLFICFNRNLAQWLSRRVPNDLRENLLVRNFHALCYDFAVNANLEFRPHESAPGMGDERIFWQTRAAEILLKSLDCPKNSRFEAIIIDEAQDFRDNWLVAVNQLLDVPKSPLYVFCDPRQNLFQNRNRNQSQSIDSLRRWTFGSQTMRLEGVLFQNCRNARNIAQYSGRIINQPLESMPGMNNGPEVKIYQTEDGAENRYMANWIIQQQLANNVAPSSLAILSHRTRKNSPLGNCQEIAGVPITEDIDLWQNNGGILYSSIRKFKGLEADSILLMDVGAYQPQDPKGFTKEEMYTGCTRARQVLSVLTSSGADPSVLA